jgi:hypothetical protein|tara:strand:- start:285 stop:500 length:216 start_codon:yes stop_codon:yes gene_type:complete
VDLYVHKLVTTVKLVSTATIVKLDQHALMAFVRAVRTIFWMETKRTSIVEVHFHAQNHVDSINNALHTMIV